MKISRAEYISGAATPQNKIKSDFLQVAVVGKSNVGKSSFINYFTNDGKLARISKQPGRTRLINYFLINREFILTDLPGYGFAKVSKAEKEQWSVLIEDYLQNEPKLCFILFLIDIRHDPTTDDLLMYNFLFKTNIPFCIIATKADKLSKAQQSNQLRRFASLLKVGEGNILPISSIKKTGKDAVSEKIILALEAAKNPVCEDI